MSGLAKQWETLYNQLVAIGAEIDNHYSDLYVKATPEVWAIVRANKVLYSTFENQRPPHVGELWIDIPFAYIPFWEQKSADAAERRASEKYNF